MKNRITPACAGTTAHLCTDADEAEDHPRLCGNDFARVTTFRHGSGSPPLVRERPVSNRKGPCPIRITPACAGTTTL